MDAAKRLESLHKLEEIKQHLLELEKQVLYQFAPIHSENDYDLVLV